MADDDLPQGYTLRQNAQPQQPQAQPRPGPGPRATPPPALQAPAPGGAPDDLPPGYTPRVEQRAPSDGPVPPGQATGSTTPGERIPWDSKLFFDSINNLPADTVDQLQQAGAGLQALTTLDGWKNIWKLGMTVPGSLGVGIDWRGIARAMKPFLGPDTAATVDQMVTDLYAPQEAIKKDYQEAYGENGLDTQRLAKTIRDHPARLLSDIATIATGGEAALAKTPGAIAKAAGVTGRVLSPLEKAQAIAHTGTKVLSNADPLGWVVSGTGAAVKQIPKVLDVTTGVGQGVMKGAFDAGSAGGKRVEEVIKGMKGETTAEDMVNRAQTGLEAIKDDMMADYKSKMAAWSSSAPGAPPPGTVNFADITHARDQLRDSFVSPAGKDLLEPGERARVSRLFDIIDMWERDPASHNIVEMDALKKKLDMATNYKSDHPQVVRAASTLRKSVLDSILKNAPPEYAEAMKAYQEGMETIKDLKDSFGVDLRKSPNKHTVMSKLQSTLRNNAFTNYGQRAQDLAELEKKGGVNLSDALTGMSLSSWEPRGLNRAVLAGSTPYGAAAAFSGLLDPVSLAAGAAGVAATSPRLMGGTMRRAGSVYGAPTRAFTRVGKKMGMADPGAFADSITSSLHAPVTTVPGRAGSRAFEQTTDEPMP